ncbi:MAG: hypothetical protein JSU82_15515 [Rhodospirillales bacterium]|nr:MAG: hypothetical protein JSU82_15515 [Rhodospirillales bacterium]
MLFEGIENVAPSDWATVIWIGLGLYGFISTDSVYMSLEKMALSCWATVVWIGSGLYLYITTEGASLISWSALVLILAGMFAAYIVFGNASFVFWRLDELIENKTGAVVARAKPFIVLRWLLAFAAETVVVFLAASWVFHKII